MMRSKREYLLIAGSVILGLVFAFTVSFWLLHGDAEEAIPRGVGAPKVPYVACVSVEDIPEDTPLLLVDLSDTTNFPHSATNTIIIKCLHYQGALTDNQQWVLNLGIITENDTTDGSVTWIHKQHRTRLAQFDERRVFAEHGLDLRVTDGEMAFVVSNSTLADTAVFSSGVVITSPVGTSSPSVGDIVIYLDEIDDSATLDYSVCICYDTE